ncbi:MAG: DNA polymerase II large subunit [Promethearchaeota archaeon]
MTVIMSDKMKKYFAEIETDVLAIYELANEARRIGIDPSTEVECPPARDMAGRVEKLVGPIGIADELRKLKEGGADQDELCFQAIDWVLEGKFEKLSKNEAVDLAIRVALAIKTEGVVSAPLEGIGKVVIRENKLGGKPYLALYFAGPIRAAGGTVQAFAVLTAEYVRQKMNIAPWIATEEEVGRMVEEVKLYDRILNLQYPSTKSELSFAVRHLTIELNGEPTESREVSAHRDLPRVDTNFVRGGPCLVLNDGVLLKAKKILRIIDKRKIEGWDWLRKLKKLAQTDDEVASDENSKDKELDYGGDTYKGKKGDIRENDDPKIIENTPVSIRRQKLDELNPPLDKYIADIIAGRPVFAYPSRIGGHRIRYGRSRNTGLAACGTHPSQMMILGKFLAIGTQIRIERPGKSSSTMPVTSIEPPIVLMDNGDVKQLWDVREAAKIIENRTLHKILFLGDILFGYGEFLENNHTMIPSGYVEEWWVRELENALQVDPLNKDKKKMIRDTGSCSSEDLHHMISHPFDHIPTAIQSLELSIKFGIGIHPRYLDHWGNINGIDLLEIRKAFETGLREKFEIPTSQPVDLSDLTLDELHKVLSNGLTIPNTVQVKTFLEKAFIVHTNQIDSLIILPARALIFIEIFGFGRTKKSNSTKPDFVQKLHDNAQTITALELFPLLTELRVPDKAPYYMGSRMGRPEKAKERKMRPPVHLLFPVGHDSKLQRDIQNASNRSKIDIEVGQKQCPDCQTMTFLNLCPKCGAHTQLKKICPNCKRIFDLKDQNCPDCRRYLVSTSKKRVPLKKYFQMAIDKIPYSIPTIKGVKGMTSEFKIPEPIEKGILRAHHGVWVYKDGTIRVDATDIPLTHFNCKEINVSVEKIRSLGYETDIYGDEITGNRQIIELRVQDVLLTHHVAEYFIHVANFVDDELEFLYHQPRFYNIKSKEDLIGHYMAGLAPHTSAAIIGRLIGFTRAESGYAHPYWHAAKRRNADGDEDGIMLLMDCLLNFSRFYLPSSLGGKMDAPLVVSLLLDPREVDGESHNVDYSSQYPLKFYLDTQNYVKPSHMESYMVLYKNHLDTPAQFEGAMFTHPTRSINLGPRKSAYTILGSMNDKIEAQLYLADIIEAVDVSEVARKVISSHFAPDILGNLRAFSTQSFRCPKCGTKYRRAPLMGKCLSCGNALLLTVHPGGIVKYLPKAQSFIEDYNLGAYTEQRWKLIAKHVKSLTDNPRVKQKSILSFFK